MTGDGEWGQNESCRTDNCGKNAAERNNPTGEGLWVTGCGLRVTGKCTNGCTILLQSSDNPPTSPDNPPTMVRLNCARARDTPPRDEVVTQAVGMLDGDVAVTLPVDERVGV